MSKYKSVQNGDDENAKEVADQYVTMMSKLFNSDWSGVYGTAQAQYKAAMNMMGQPGGYPRLPILPIENPKSLAEIQATLTSSGLLDIPVRARAV